MEEVLKLLNPYFEQLKKLEDTDLENIKELEDINFENPKIELSKSEFKEKLLKLDSLKELNKIQTIVEEATERASVLYDKINDKRKKDPINFVTLCLEGESVVIPFLLLIRSGVLVLFFQKLSLKLAKIKEEKFLTVKKDNK